ncbi:MAG: GNAT family N-acetyltransferase [Solirubrobacteraceae bacterium]
MNRSPSLLLRDLRAGERWCPHYYEKLGSAGRRRFAPRPGYQVLGAYLDGELVGCVEFSLCSFDELVESGEYHCGDPRNGPFFHEPSAGATRFLLVHSLRVNPSQREAGVGSALCRRLAALGLPAYAEFADEWVGQWAQRCFRPRLGPCTAAESSAARTSVLLATDT